MPVRQRVRYRGGIKGELALAVLPTSTVMGVFLLVRVFANQTYLFTSLASSSFLIYRDPEHRMNAVKVMVPAHITAAVVGLGTFWIFGEGYLSGALAMALTIAVLIVFGIVHPPAISTSLIFSFRTHQENEFIVFLMALAMVAVLYVSHLVAVALVRMIASDS